jgi:hypothetical protein
MSMTDPTTTPPVEDPDEPEGVRNLRGALEREKARGDEGAIAVRELALVKAGVDTDSPIGKMFAQTYAGELEPEAIKAAWGEVAPAATPPAPEADPATPPPTTESAASRGLGSGEGEPPPPPTGPVTSGTDQAFQHYQDEVKSGMDKKTASGNVFGDILTRAAAGDPTAVFDHQAHAAAAAEVS